MSTTDIAPKVFISYSHDNQKHKNWVLKLATHLREFGGVDVVLDQWDLILGNNLPFFMEQGLTNSNLVICICSDTYVEKANAGKGGVGYEKKILSADIMNDTSLNYIIPVMHNSSNKTLPTFLSGAFYADFMDESLYYDKFRELVARIHNEDQSIKPPIGKNPFKHNEVSNTISTNVQLSKTEFHNPALQGKVSFDYKRNSGIYTIGVGENLFEINWSECGINSIYCYRDRVKRLGYNPQYDNFPPFDEIPNFDFTSRSHHINVGQVVILENRNGRFAALKVTKVFKNNVDINHILEFVYKIYDTITI